MVLLALYMMEKISDLEIIPSSLEIIWPFHEQERTGNHTLSWTEKTLAKEIRCFWKTMLGINYRPKVLVISLLRCGTRALSEIFACRHPISLTHHLPAQDIVRRAVV